MPLHVLLYMKNSQVVTITMGFQESIIDGTMMSGEVVRTDGVWTWSSNVIHYYENNGLILPKDFLKHIKRKTLIYTLWFRFKVFLSGGKIVMKIYETLVKDFSERKSGTEPKE